MKRLLLYLNIFLLSLAIGINSQPVNNKPINKQIGAYIRQNCEENKPCTIEIKNAIDFSWDKLYVFDEAVKVEEISKVLKTHYSATSLDYSRRWFFLKGNQIVRTEEHIFYNIHVGGDAGDILFTEDNPKEHLSIYRQDAIFEVTKKEFDNADPYYNLRCINCLSN